jgi:hypothetical protein
MVGAWERLLNAETVWFLIACSGFLQYADIAVGVVKPTRVSSQNGMVSIPLEAPRSIFYGNGEHPNEWHPDGWMLPGKRTPRIATTRGGSSTSSSIPIRTSLA